MERKAVTAQGTLQHLTGNQCRQFFVLFFFLQSAMDRRSLLSNFERRGRKSWASPTELLGKQEIGSTSHDLFSWAGAGHFSCMMGKSTLALK